MTAKHLAFIRTLPCLACCTSYNVQAAHIRKGTDAGMGQKPHNKWTVPLCATCHIYQHGTGELSFYGGEKGINEAHRVALSLHENTGNREKALETLTSSSLWGMM